MQDFTLNEYRVFPETHQPHESTQGEGFKPNHHGNDSDAFREGMNPSPTVWI